MKRQYARNLGIDFNYPMPSVFGIDIRTGKINHIEYLYLATKFCKSKKCRRKARWLRKFSRRLNKWRD